MQSVKTTEHNERFKGLFTLDSKAMTTVFDFHCCFKGILGDFAIFTLDQNLIILFCHNQNILT